VWVDVPLSQVVRDISMQANVTIAVDPSVADQLISLEAEGMPLEGCLRRLTAGQGLGVRKVEEGLYVLGSMQPGSPSFDELADCQRVYLHYITARHLRECLPQELRLYVSSGDRDTEVLVFAPPEKMERIMGIHSRLDVPRRQVVLEALVVELSEEGGRALGIDWEYAGRDTLISLTEAAEGFIGVARHTSIDERAFRTCMITLRMLVSEGLAAIRSRPRVATLNGEKATIDVSLEEYFNIVTDVNGAFLRTELQIIKSGVILEMVPQIGDEGDITVGVSTEVSDVVTRRNTLTTDNGDSADDLPVIRRRKAETRVRVKAGDVIVIGGLVESEERHHEKRVPVLGSIPILGLLFRSTETTTEQREVVIFITPRLVEADADPFADRHDLIDVETELEGVRAGSAPTSLNEQGMELLREGIAEALSVVGLPRMGQAGVSAGG
jgi:type II secretory pathway component GspD/PulD (secretin)